MNLTLEQEAEVREYRVHGVSFAEISRDMEIPYHALYGKFRLPERGYTPKEYNRHLIRINSKRWSNQTLSRLISDRLEEFGKSAGWLARETGTTTATINRARSGKTIPRPTLLRDIFRVLGLPYNNLKEMIADNPPA